MKKIILLLSILSSFLSSAGVPALGAEENRAHVIINQVYGGGDRNDIEAPVSHSFVELYNPTDKDIDLSGWSLQYSHEGDSWQVLELKGIIKAGSSFLVRGGPHNPNGRLKISEYDQEWGITFDNKGLKLALVSNTKSLTAANPYSAAAAGYVDMVGVAGNEWYYTIDGCETDYLQIQSKQKSVRRKHFRDTDNNAKDLAAIDYRTVVLEDVRPRSSADGAWSVEVYERKKEISKPTLENTDGEFTFVHVSDTQAATEGQFKVWGALADMIGKNCPESAFSIHTGDLTDNPDSKEELDMFYDNSGVLTEKPFLPAMGNHDQKKGTDPSVMCSYFSEMPGSAPLPVSPGTTASFDYGNAHFVILNTEDDLSAQVKWLDEELSKTQKKWKIVAMHRSPYGAAGTDDTMVFTPVFDKHHVDLVLHGHDHLYVRTYPLYGGKKSAGGTVYLESGSSGVKQEKPMNKQYYQEVSKSPQNPSFSAITVSEDRISVKAQTLNGRTLETIDEFEIKKYTGEYESTDYSYEFSDSLNFSDIRVDRPYRDSIMLLSELGIIPVESSFRGESKISGAEFQEWLSAASLTDKKICEGNITLDFAVDDILDRLGYTPVLKLYDKQAVADDIGLLKDISVSGGEELTRGQAAILLKNAMECYNVRPVSADLSEYAQVYYTWLTDLHDTIKIEAVITDRPYYTSSSAQEHVVLRTNSGEVLSAACVSDELCDMLGYNVNAYVKGSGDSASLIWAVKRPENKTLIVKKSWYQEIDSVDNGIISFEYRDDSGTVKRVKISADADFVYNGAKSDIIKKKTLAMAKNAFKPSHIGKIYLTDINSDSVYDYVFIDNFKDMVVAEADSGGFRVTNKLEYIDGVSVKESKYTEIGSITLDPENTAYKTIFKKENEKTASFREIAPGSVISVALSSTDEEPPDSALVRRVYISNLMACGRITSVYEEEEDDYIVVGGKSYRASKSYYNTYNGGESVDFANLKVGSYVTLYLDYDERFAYVEDYRGETGYGIILRAFEDDNGENYMVKLVDSEGLSGTYALSRRLYEKSGLNNAALPSAAVLSRDSSGNIITLELKAVPEVSAESGWLAASGRLGSYFINSDTEILMYCGQMADGAAGEADKYSKASIGELTDGYTYSADFYDITDYRYPSFVVLYFDGFRELMRSEPVMAVTAVVEADKGSGEKAYFIHGISAAGELVTEVDESLYMLPGKNDVIRYRLLGGKIVKWDLMCGGESEDFSVNTALDDIFYAFRGNIVSVDSEAVTVHSDGYENYAVSPSVKVFSLEPGERGVFKADSMDCITRDDRIFFKAEEGIINEIYVWK
ncbi:MAG: metallophosphoesterase [Clostridia bacterium]|nr:metallophosphoesterase [Clostridia bacterium]